MISTRARAGLALTILSLSVHAGAAGLSPEPWVRKIKVRGAHQLSSRTILDRIDMKTWRPLPEDATKVVPGQVVEVYARAGLPKPVVTVAIGAPDGTGAVRVTLDLVETPLPKLDSFSSDYDGLPWLRALPTRAKRFYLEIDAKLWRFNRKELDDSVRKDQRRLRGLGWKGATYNIEEKSTQGGDARAIAVSLDLGLREKLKGKGIDRQVNQDVTSTWKRRNVPLSEGVVARLAKAAEEGMVERGYVDVVVSPSERKGDKEKTVILTCTHGPRLSVQEIRFVGASSLPEKELLAAISLHEPQLLGLSKSHPGPALLGESRLALVDLYARSGFPDARVEATMEGSGDARTVVFRVAEGQRRRIGKLSFPGASTIPESELRRITKLSVGMPYWPGGDAAAVEAVKKAYAKLGFDEATVTPRPSQPDGEGRVELAFEVVEGSSYRFGEITVRGNYKTRASRILSLGDERRGRLLDSGQLAEHQARLSRLGIFDTVSVKTSPVPGTQPPEKSVVIEVAERSTRYVEWGFDLNSDRGLELAGTLGERNLFGDSINGSISALAGKTRQSYTLDVSQPSIFGTRIVNAIKGTYTWDTSYDGFSLQTIGAQIGFSWEFEPKQYANLVYRLEEEQPLDVQPDVEQELLPETTKIGSVSPSVSLDHRDDPFQTTRGWYFLFTDKASRKYLGGDADFDRVEVDARRFLNMGSGVTLAGAVRGGYAWAHGGSELPVGERFYVGGASTHRGFRQNELGPKGEDGSSLGGESYLLLNAEVRAPLLGRMDWGAFLDVGNAWLGGMELSDLRWALGLGLRFRTPIGPLRLDTGYLLDAREGESRTVVHFAIGHAF